MKLTELALLSLQTAFMQRDLTTQGMCASVQGQLRDTAAATYNILMYQALDTLGDTKFSNELADELAWQFHVDFYDKSASYEVKKNLIKQSIKIHQKKGTPQAIIDLIQTAFPTEVYLMEWFNYGGKPYHFKLVTSELPTADDEAKVRKAIQTVKNARSFLESIELFKSTFNYAVMNIEKNREISYVTPVGFFINYVFQNDEVLTFGLGEKAYSFIDTEVN